MKDLKIDIRNESDSIKERFKGVDLVSLEDLLADYEELIFDYKNLENEFDDFKRDVDENYKLVDTDPYDYYGVSREDFI